MKVYVVCNIERGCFGPFTKGEVHAYALRMEGWDDPWTVFEIDPTDLPVFEPQAPPSCWA